MREDSWQFGELREKLVAQLRRKHIVDERVLTAINHVPRHRFINPEFWQLAYEDHPLPIAAEQPISQPFTVAFQTQLLQLNGGERILEIGTGSGYQTAILCEMGGHVFSIERQRELYERAYKILHELGYSAQLFFGDGYEGLTSLAPFEKILLTAATPVAPKKLLQQLAVGGSMVVPLGDSLGQTMTLIQRTGEHEFHYAEHGSFIFVPMQHGIVG